MSTGKKHVKKTEENINGAEDLQLKWKEKLDASMDMLLDEAIHLALNAKSESVRAQMLKELINKNLPKTISPGDEDSAPEYNADDLREMKDEELIKLWKKVFDQCIRGKENT
jgi:hypothetical protein